MRSLWPLALAVSIGLFIGMWLREAGAQAENRTRCAANGGEYIQHGHYSYSGLCIKPGGMLWRR